MTMQTAIFAGGCFWCMVEPFETLPGIDKVRSGYTGGTVENPSYEQMAAHITGHTEAVKIWFDDDIISYDELVTLYWQLADPTDAMGQFADRGETYRPVIFVKDEAQRQVAESSKQALAASGRFDKPIVTTIEDAKPFYDAEEEHQQFYKKNPLREMMMMMPRKKYQKQYWSDKERN
ncbi:peptide-methionine (S)-S-oxide reductase MsrA [Weissella sagaensis]|uniref:Peptide methionine sulfoxide reductase MsrA n=1 Tax=Weissella sagaensis TaxID=2559928 RepID=A0ABW1RSP7_9LACO|nr:peptide-methionine (S)-S-oxide reductase MsrA [Weissella sagaensis]